MMPDVSDALLDWVSPYELKTVTRSTVDFVESTSVARSTINAMIQPADPTRLTAAQIDWSLKYISIHSIDAVVVGQFVEYGGEDYKIISATDWSAYGYTRAIGEQTRRAVL